MESIIVEINGVQYQNSQVKSFLTFYEDGVLRVALTVTDGVIQEDVTERKEQSEDLTQPYILEGTEYSVDDEMYKKIKELSNLRGHSKKKGIKDTREIQSNSYNIKDVTCFENAITEIIKQENELFDQGYRFFAEITKPVATFESAESGTFKLTEKIVVIKNEKITAKSK